MENSLSDNAFSAWKAFYIKTGKQPNALYLGADEYAKFKSLPDSIFTANDDRLNGNSPSFKGMKIYRVDAKSHLVVDLI